MKHAHAEILHRLADDCELAVWFWHTASKEWIAYVAVSIIADTKGQYQFVLGDKPTSPPKRYSMVEGVKVPMTHLTEALAYNEKFWLIDSAGNVDWERWVGVNSNRGYLANHNVYATEADAQEAAAAWAQVRRQASERAK